MMDNNRLHAVEATSLSTACTWRPGETGVYGSYYACKLMGMELTREHIRYRRATELLQGKAGGCGRQSC